MVFSTGSAGMITSPTTTTTAFPTGTIAISTGAASQGLSGGITIGSGSADTGIYPSGSPSGSGAISITSGGATNSDTGDMTFKSGATSGSVGKSGAVYIGSGDSISGTGSVYVTVGSGWGSVSTPGELVLSAGKSRSNSGGKVFMYPLLCATCTVHLTLFVSLFFVVFVGNNHVRLFQWWEWRYCYEYTSSWRQWWYNRFHFYQNRCVELFLCKLCVDCPNLFISNSPVVCFIFV